MPRLDYYATLEVSPTASDYDIKRAYRRLALLFHPDRNQGSKEAEAKIREINEAYEILGDPENRKSYERLRFGGYGTKTDPYPDHQTDTVDPGVILDGMEKKLWDEGRREVFGVLIKDLSLVKEELAIIREMTIQLLGYDKFHEDAVKQRARITIEKLITVDMKLKQQRLLDVALQMMLSQGISGTGGKQETAWLERKLAKAYTQGRIDGFCEACELLYVRR